MLKYHIWLHAFNKNIFIKHGDITWRFLIGQKDSDIIRRWPKTGHMHRLFRNLIIDIMVNIYIMYVLF